MVRRWALWITAAVSIIAALSAVFWPSLALPQAVYWLIAAVGVFWSGYDVYRDTVRRIPNTDARDQEPPRVAIGAVEGSEYSFALQHDNQLRIRKLQKELKALQAASPNDAEKESHDAKVERVRAEIDLLQGEDEISDAHLDLNVRINNDDERPLTVIALKATDRLRPIDVWFPWVQECLDSDGVSQLQFPVELAAGGVLVAQVRVSLKAGPGLNRAQFASQLPARTSTSEASFRIEAQVRNGGDVHKVSSTCKVSFGPLRDLYLDHWRARSLDDLVGLASSKIWPAQE